MRSPVVVSSLTFLLSLVISNATVAQTSPAPCETPQGNEYLLLVSTETKEAQERLRRALPNNTNALVCQYQGDIVSRIGSFADLSTADQWGKYIREIVGLTVAIATPPASSATAQTAPVPPFNPQPLNNGYAVLVNYFNEPEVATQLQELLGKEIGLASYLARPYLLTLYTQSEPEANAILRQLSDRGFWAVVVDSRRVTLLTPEVRY